MSELIFVVEDDLSGGYTARALGASIFTEAETKDELVLNVKEAVELYYHNPADAPKLIRLHFVRVEAFAL